MAVELLARVRAEIEHRLADLRPAVAEYEQLIGVTDALGTDGPGTGAPPKRAAPPKATGRVKGDARPKATGRVKGDARPKATGRVKGDARPKATGGPKKPVRRSSPGARAPGTRASKTSSKTSSKTRTAESAAEQAIVAALEHGSHTVAELVLVSALPGAQIRAALRPLLKAGTVIRAKRDGLTAYALASAA